MAGTFINTSLPARCKPNCERSFVRRPSDLVGGCRSDSVLGDSSNSLPPTGRLIMCHAQGKDGSGGEDDVDMDELLRKLSSEASRMRDEHRVPPPQLFEPAASSTDVCVSSLPPLPLYHKPETVFH
jgi:hypothetical protein